MGAHGIRRSVPLWLLIVATQLPDWADATLCIAGVRSTVPGLYSHSLVAVGVLAAAAALFGAASLRDSRGGLLVGVVVASHALGDYFTGSKPTWSGGPTVGLLLYDRPALDFILEAAIVTAGWLLYQRSFPDDRRYSRDSVALLAALLVIQAAADIVLALTEGMKKC
jgi:hypothetical protein